MDQLAKMIVKAVLINLYQMDLLADSWCSSEK